MQSGRGMAGSLLYRRGNFNGSWDDVICDAIRAERDVEIALSPGFRWGTTLLPGQDITIDDMYTQTSMNYPAVYRTEFTGKQLKGVLEDVCDNLFNPDPFFQQGGDMVRVGGMSYRCAPKAEMGSRISEMVLTVRVYRSSQKIHGRRLGVCQSQYEGPAIYDLLESYIKAQGDVTPSANQSVIVDGMN